MHKSYPYLQDSFIYNTNLETQKRSLLKKIEQQVVQRQYIQITLLDWDENPIKSLEGEITSGSISKVATSPVRRTANLSCSVNAGSYSVEDAKMDFAINKKIFIEIGVKNETDAYPEYPIYWFPEGVFFIGSFSINASAAGSVNISLSLKDKMAMLNGDVGGKIPITTIFDSMDTQLPNGEYVEQKVLIYNIIKELVNHFGGESLNRIVIEGVPLRIRRIMQWTGDDPLWAHAITEDMGTINQDYTYTLENHKGEDGWIEYSKGDDIGYVMDDFVISNELTAAPGESVTSVLDKIKNILGNYEYFYDVFGVFHFREIKNYYVTTQARTLLDEMNKNVPYLGTNISEEDYLVDTNNSKSIFTFDSINLLTSINVTPQYENIKNDYIIEGKTQSDSGVTFNVRYHLAIDDKPLVLGTDNRETVYQLEELNETDANTLEILNEYKVKLIAQEKALSETTEQIDKLTESNKNLSKSWNDYDKEFYEWLRPRIFSLGEAGPYWDGNKMVHFIPKVEEGIKGITKEDIETYSLSGLLMTVYNKSGAGGHTFTPVEKEKWTGVNKNHLINSVMRDYYAFRIEMYNKIKEKCSEEEKIIVEQALQNIEHEWKYSSESSSYTGLGYEKLCYYDEKLRDIEATINQNNDDLQDLKDNKEDIEKEIKDIQKNIDIYEEDWTAIKKNRGYDSVDNPSKEKSFYGIYPSYSDMFGDDESATPTLIFYLHPRGNYPTAAYVANVLELPEVGNFNLVYCEQNTKDYKYWDGQTYLSIDPTNVYTTESGHEYYATDWRTKLYLDGMQGVVNGTDKGYYYEELAAFWPMVYDLKNQCFYGESDSDATYYKTLTTGIYYLDFLDSLSTSFGEWNVNNIGRRTDIVVNDQINCLFQPEIPNVVILPTTAEAATADGWNALEEGRTLEELKQEAIDNYYPWAIVDDKIYNKLLTGGYKNAAFDQIKYELYLHTRYQKSVSMNSIPVFYLEPNSRVTIDDIITNTYGDYVVQSINITLGPGANMSITCNETAERF